MARAGRCWLRNHAEPPTPKALYPAAQGRVLAPWGLFTPKALYPAAQGRVLAPWGLFTPKALYPAAQGRVLAHPGGMPCQSPCTPKGFDKTRQRLLVQPLRGRYTRLRHASQGARVRDPGLWDTTPSA